MRFASDDCRFPHVTLEGSGSHHQPFFSGRGGRPRHANGNGFAGVTEKLAGMTIRGVSHFPFCIDRVRFNSITRIIPIERMRAIPPRTRCAPVMPMAIKIITSQTVSDPIKNLSRQNKEFPMQMSSQYSLDPSHLRHATPEQTAC